MISGWVRRGDACVWAFVHAAGMRWASRPLGRSCLLASGEARNRGSPSIAALRAPACFWVVLRRRRLVVADVGAAGGDPTPGSAGESGAVAGEAMDGVLLYCTYSSFNQIESNTQTDSLKIRNIPFTHAHCLSEYAKVFHIHVHVLNKK